jgi:hypothetical protein
MDNNEDRYRIVTVLTAKEKAWLQRLAWKNGRSMSGYIRYLIVQEIEANS